MYISHLTDLLFQKDVLAHFNKIVLQNGNVMKFAHIRRNMWWNNYLIFNFTRYIHLRHYLTAYGAPKALVSWLKTSGL